MVAPLPAKRVARQKGKLRSTKIHSPWLTGPLLIIIIAPVNRRASELSRSRVVMLSRTGVKIAALHPGTTRACRRLMRPAGFLGKTSSFQLLLQAKQIVLLDLRESCNKARINAWRAGGRLKPGTSTRPCIPAKSKSAAPAWPKIPGTRRCLKGRLWRATAGEASAGSPSSHGEGAMWLVQISHMQCWIQT